MAKGDEGIGVEGVSDVDVVSPWIPSFARCPPTQFVTLVGGEPLDDETVTEIVRQIESAQPSTSWKNAVVRANASAEWAASCTSGRWSLKKA